MSFDAFLFIVLLSWILVKLMWVRDHFYNIFTLLVSLPIRRLPEEPLAARN